MRLSICKPAQRRSRIPHIVALVIAAALGWSTEARALVSDAELDTETAQHELERTLEWTPARTRELLGPARALPMPAPWSDEAIVLRLDMRDDGYNTAYFFAMTRGIAGSTLRTWAKPIFYIFTIPLDIVCVPFAAIGGFF